MREHSSVRTVEWEKKLSKYSSATETVTDEYEDVYLRRSEPVSTVPVAPGVYAHPTGYYVEAIERTHGMAYGSRWGWQYLPPLNDAIVGLTINVSLVDISNEINEAIVAAGNADVNWGETFGELGSLVAKWTRGSKALRDVSIDLSRGQFRKAAYTAAKHTFGSEGRKKAKEFLKGLNKSRKRLIGSSDAHLPTAGKNALKEAADIHLLILFGIMPLVEDVEYAATEFSAKNAQNLRIGGTIVGSSYNSENETSDDQYYDPYGGRYELKINRRLLRRVKLRYVVDRDSFLYKLNSFGLANPFKTAYDLIPMSFVFDRFLNLGNYLGSLTSTSGLRFTDGYASIVHEATPTFGKKLQDAWLGRTLVQFQTSTNFAFERRKVTSDHARVPRITLGGAQCSTEEGFTALSLGLQRLL